MRINERTTSLNAIFNINEGRIKLDRLNEKIATGKNTNRPSDDPVAAKKILEIETQIKTTTQYISNIKTGKTSLAIAGTSLEGLFGTVMSIRGTAGQAIAGLTDPIKKVEILEQLKFFRAQLIDYPNAQLGNQYVFSGFKSDKLPFGDSTVTADISAGSYTINSIDTTDLYVGLPISGPGIPPNSTVASIVSPSAGGGNHNGTITFTNPSTPPAAPIPATESKAAGTLKFNSKFTGSEDTVSIEISQGVQIPITVSGGKVLRGGTPPGSSGVDIIKTVDTLIADINSGNIPGILASNLALDKASQEMLGAISDVGMRKARIENALESQQRNYNVLSKIHDELQNVDMAAAAIAISNQKIAFEAALAATAKIAPLSLLNYM